MSTSDKQDLAARLARGDEAAFAELYDACGAKLHHYVATRLESRDRAADVVQSAFLRAVKSRRRFRGVENPIAYMFQIARNEAYRALRKRDRNSQLPAMTESDSQSGVSRKLFDEAELVSVGLARLTPEDREIVGLKIFGQFTFGEIAEVTELPQATVATRYRRALESLRPWMAQQLK